MADCGHAAEAAGKTWSIDAEPGSTAGRGWSAVASRRSADRVGLPWSSNIADSPPAFVYLASKRPLHKRTSACRREIFHVEAWRGRSNSGLKQPPHCCGRGPLCLQTDHYLSELVGIYAAADRPPGKRGCKYGKHGPRAWHYWHSITDSVTTRRIEHARCSTFDTRGNSPLFCFWRGRGARGQPLEIERTIPDLSSWLAAHKNKGQPPRTQEHPY